MRRSYLFPLFIFLLLLLAACTAFPTAVPSPPPALPTASPTPTASPIPTFTPTPTPTLLPSPTPTPTDHPFDLGNAAKMVHLTQAGDGTLGQIATSPDGKTLAIAGSEGLWLLDKLHLNVLTHLTGHAGAVTSVSWSPDGTRLVTGGEDKTVRVWDVTALLAGTGPAEQIHLLVAHSKRITAVAWSPDPTLIASSSEDGNVWIWQLSQTQQGEDDARALQQLSHITAVYALAWHPAGRFLATASLDSTLDLWDAPAGLHLGTLEGHEGWATALAWNPVGTILASGATDRTLRLWDVNFTIPSNPSAKPTARFASRAVIQALYNLSALLWTTDGSEIISAGGSPFTIDFWDPAPSETPDEPETRQAKRTLIGHIAAVNGLTFASNGVLISTGADTTVRVWNLATGQEIRHLSPTTFAAPPFTAPIQALAWSPDGAQLASAHTDYTIRLWQTDGITLTQTDVLTGHQNLVNSIDWSPNGKWLATGSNDNTTRLWDAQTGQLIQTYKSEGGKVNAVAFSHLSDQLATGGLFRIAQIWQVGTDQAPILINVNAEITQLAWASTGLLAIGGSDGDITVWDVATSTQIFLLTGEHTNPITGLAWAPDGSQLATLDNLGKLTIWDASNGLPLTKNILSGTRRAALAWSPNGQLLATANGPKIYLLDALSGNPLRLLTGHTSEVRALAWKPDGAQLASAGQDGSLQLWAMLAEETYPTPAVSPAPNPIIPPVRASSSLPITLDNANQVQQLAQLGRGTALHLAPNPQGSLLAVAGGLGTWIYDTPTWELLCLLPGNKTYASAWSPDGNLLAVRELTSVLVWDVAKAQVIRVFGADIGVLPNLSWSPDGQFLAVGNFRGVVRVLSLATGDVLYEWQLGRDITSVAWSPDGRTLAAGGTAPDTDAGFVWLWDIPTGSPVNILDGPTARVTHLAWSPNGTQLLAADDSLALTIWDISTLEIPPIPAEGETITFPSLTRQTLTNNALTGIKAITWNNDGEILITGDTSGLISFWSASGGMVQSTLTTPPGLVSAAWNGENLFALERDGQIQIWNVTVGEMMTSDHAHSAEVRVSQWTGEALFIAGVDGTFEQIEIDGTLVQTQTLDYLPSGIAYSANSHQVAVRTSDGSVEVFPFGGGTGRSISQGSGEPNTDWLVDWSEDANALAWNQTRAGITLVEGMNFSTNESFSLSGAETKITALSWSPDASTGENSRRNSTLFRLAGGTEDGKVIVWDVSTGRVLRTIQAYSGRVRVLAWAPDGKTFATGGSDGQDNGGFQFVRIWNASTGRLLREIQLPFGHEAYALAWSPDGTVLASGDSFGEIILWNPAKGEMVGTLQGHTQTVISLDWSRVTNALVSGSRDGTVRVWGIENK